ncbi:MAG: anthranilate synthase component I family protein [Candidatus Hydrogenedentota bacterium]
MNYIEKIPFNGNAIDIFERIFDNKTLNIFFYSPKLKLKRTKSWIKDASRYSIILKEPQKIVTSKTLNDDIFKIIEKNICPVSTKKTVLRPPFTGGWAGIMSYEMLGLFENIHIARIDKKLNLPYYIFGLFKKGIIIDNYTNILYVFGNNNKEVDLILKEIKSPGYHLPCCTIRDTKWTGMVPKNKFLKMVKKAKYYIKEGDIYQVNLAQPFKLYKNSKNNTFHIFRKLMNVNPSPFSCYLNYKDEIEVISCSPERLFKKSGNYIETRPIAGTYPIKQKNSFKRDTKELAEHIMLVDLERNDLGRIAETGSVKVQDLLEIEEYSHLIHLVSRITTKLKKNITIKDIFRAIFPGGTITGCPKVRAMQIISELESYPREFYTGAAGYISFDSNMDFNIIIRTLVFKGIEGRLYTGAGIVADSIPRNEYKETLRKAEAFFEIIRDK